MEGVERQMTQCQAILEYLKDGKTWIDWEIARIHPTILSNNLTGRLDNLEDKGYKFENRWKTLASGKECKEYRLVSDIDKPENAPGKGDAYEEDVI